MLKFLEMNWFPILCASILAAIFVLFIISRIDLYFRATRHGVAAELEKSHTFKKYEVEEIDIQTLESKGTKKN